MNDSATGIDVEGRSGGDVWITIDRADKHNALSRSMLDTLAQAVTRHAADARTHCIIVRGAGDRYFPAGGDIVDLAEVRTQAQTEAMTIDATAALDAIRFCDVPVIEVLRALKAQVAIGRKTGTYRAQCDVERRNLIATWLHADHWTAVERFLAWD